MVDAHSPLLARLERARTQGALDRAAVPWLLFERYRLVTRQWTRADRTAVRPGATEDLRARLAEPDVRSDARGDELLLAILEGIETLERGDAAMMHAAFEAIYAGWIEYAIMTYDAGDVDAATYIVAQVGSDAESTGHWMLAARARNYEGLLALRGARLDEAETLLRRCEQLARRSRSASMVYRARIGLANVTRLRGNLPAADAMFVRILRGARRNAPDVVPRALLMRSNVAHARGDYAAAVAFCARALHTAEDERMRARILIELACHIAEFADSELADIARQILEHATVHSPEHATRQHAATILLGLAVDQRRRDDFAKWRATLRSAALPPRQAIYFALDTVRGVRAFALPDDPIPYLDEAERIAVQHGLSQFTFMIAEARERMARAGAGQVEPTAVESTHAPASAPRGVHTTARRVAELLATSTTGASEAWER